MKHFYRFLLVLISLPVLLQAQTANHVVISQLATRGNSTANDEFVEIYNPTSGAADISGWKLEYKSATGSTWSTKLTVPAGTSLPAHCFYLFAAGAGYYSGPTAADLAMPASTNIGIADNGHIHIINASASEVDKVGFGSTAIDPEGSAAPNHGTTANNNSIERKASATSTAQSLAAGGSEETAGNGYDTDNNSADFILQTNGRHPHNLASPPEPSLSVGGNGTGTAFIQPASMEANQTSSVTISVAGDGTNTLDSVVIIMPAGWNWPQASGSVSLSGSGFTAGSVSVTSDTIYLGHGAITNTDTGKITIANVTAPDASGKATFVVKTALNGGEPIQIASAVSINLIKVIPIILLHQNDAQGVPVAPYGLGSVVTISGIITADLSTTQTQVYLQDATAGINIFNYTRSYNYQVGDSVTFTGALQQYRGGNEVVPDSAKTIFHSHGNSLPEPFLVTADDVNHTFNTDDFSEPNEGRLVRINNVTYDAANSTITDATGTTGVFIPNTWTAPTGAFDLIGILKQFKPGTPAPPAPYTSDYEITPRTQDDVIAHAGAVLAAPPYESDIHSNSVVINIKTKSLSTAVVKYGVTTSYTDSVSVSSSDSVHAVTIPNLHSSTVYHYQVVVKDTAGANAAGDEIFSTASPSTSTGTMNVYFNHSVNPSVAMAETAQTVNIVDKFIHRIQAAQYSIDVALYSLSGTVGTNIANALLDARNRGVKVRMIVEYDNSTTAPMTQLKNSGMPFITDKFDPVNNGNGLMHNKFGVFDYRDTTSASDDWVWAGSWNATDPGNNNDAQNVVEIQDQALAHAYTMEFNEMWGSDTDTPNASTSRFGLHKTDNTPHRFNINGTPLESYFSPSDHTTMHIADALSTATQAIDICMLTFTRDDLAQTLISKKNSGVKVHVILDNNTDTGNQFSVMQTAGVDIRLKASSLGGLLHHKYAVIDAENPQADDVVITGSHNWSSSAETANNENTLMIHSKRIANLYLQEFKQRYIDAGGTDNIVLDVKQISPNIPLTTALGQNYPNPFNPATHIQFSVTDLQLVTLKVYDVLGREVATLLNEQKSPGTYDVQWNASNMASGVYFYRLTAGNFIATKKLLLMK